jgi:hypothetical protein
MCSGVGIIMISAIVIIGAWWKGDANTVGVIEKVFNALIPLFGTWVGTVMAFYFARENYETAAKNTRELVGQLGDERLKTILVKDAWIPAAAIEAVTVEVGQEGTIKISDMKKKLSNKVTRIPIWNSAKVVRYVIHESMIYKYLADVHEDHAVKVAAAVNNQQPAPPVVEKTLDDFLNCQLNGVLMKDVVSKIGWVAQEATLADAKAKMEGTPNCQDVFVTNSGSKDEAVLGWVTNADIAKKAKT